MIGCKRACAILLLIFLINVINSSEKNIEKCQCIRFCSGDEPLREFFSSVFNASRGGGLIVGDDAGGALYFEKHGGLIVGDDAEGALYFDEHFNVVLRTYRILRGEPSCTNETIVDVLEYGKFHNFSFLVVLIKLNNFFK